MIGWNSPSSRSCYGEDKAVIVSAPYFFLNSKSDWRRRNEPASHKSPPWLCCCCRCWPRSACPLMNSTTWKPFHLWAHLDQPWSQKTIESHQLTHNTKTLTRPPLHLWTPITIHSPVSHFGLQITPPPLLFIFTATTQTYKHQCGVGWGVGRWPKVEQPRWPQHTSLSCLALQLVPGQHRYCCWDVWETEES